MPCAARPRHDRGHALSTSVETRSFRLRSRACQRPNCALRRPELRLNSRKRATFDIDSDNPPAITVRNYCDCSDRTDRNVSRELRIHKRAPGQNLPWLRELREKAFARFCETGFPTTHEEDWRFTNVSPIAKTSFQLAADEKLPSLEQVKPFFVRAWHVSWCL